MTQHEDAAQRTYYERRLDEIRSKFRSDAPNFDLEHIDVHFLLSLALMGHEGNCTAERTRLLDRLVKADAEIARLNKELEIHRKLRDTLLEKIAKYHFTLRDIWSRCVAGTAIYNICEAALKDENDYPAGGVAREGE